MGRITTLNKEDPSDPLAKSREVTGKDLGDGGGGSHALDVNTESFGTTSKKIAPDSGTATTLYVGYAKPGSGGSEAAAIWAIKRIENPSTDTWQIEWADGDQEFNNIWNDRESLTYET